MSPRAQVHKPLMKKFCDFPDDLQRQKPKQMPFSSPPVGGQKKHGADGPAPCSWQDRRGSAAILPYSAAIFGVAASSAADRRGGDIGRSVMRTPVARATALPMAASGGTIGTSPTPRTP